MVEAIDRVLKLDADEAAYLHALARPRPKRAPRQRAPCPRGQGPSAPCACMASELRIGMLARTPIQVKANSLKPRPDVPTG